METGTSRPPRSPWIERGVFLAVIAALGLWLAYSTVMGVPHAITVDGRPVVNVESRSEAKWVLAEVKHRQLRGKQVESPAFAQRVSIRRAADNAEIDSRDDAVSTLDELLVLKALGYAIVVDGQAAASLPNEKDAYRTLDLLKKRYSQRLKHLYALPVFKEDVIVDRRYLPVDKMLSTPDDAVDYLTTIHEKPAYHLIKPGDRAVRITAQYGISLEELKRLNPGVDMDRLTEGDRLLVSRPKQPVTVIVKALITKITPVKTPAERGVPARTGKRQTWAVITYENGHEVSQDAIRVMTTWDKPAPRSSSSYSHSYSGSSSGKRYYRHYSYKRSTSSKSSPSGTETRTAPSQPKPAPTQPAQPVQPAQPSQPTTP